MRTREIHSQSRGRCGQQTCNPLVIRASVTFVLYKNFLSKLPGDLRRMRTKWNHCL